MSAADHDYSLLTQDEIDAINDDPSPEELITMRQAQVAELEDDDDDEGADSDDSQAEEAPEKPTEDAEPEQADTEEPVEDKPLSKQAPQPAPFYEARLPDNFQEQVDQIKAEREELRQAYKNGDIDFDEHEQKRDEIDERARALERAITKAEIAQDIQSQTAQKTWNEKLVTFVDTDAMADGIDYREDAAKRGDFDMFLKTLASKPENTGNSDEWFIEQAHKLVKALHGIAINPGKTQPKPNRKAPVSDIPQTLANVPGGDDASEIEGKFSHLDKLVGDAFEDAFARLTPAQQDEYRRGA